MSARECAGCGTILPPNRKPGMPRKWCSERCRKASYGDLCIDCGTRTGFGAEQARVPEPRCPACAIEARRWKREEIIERIQEWATIYGGPPAESDWEPWHAQHVLHDAGRAQRFRDGSGHWPSLATVFRVFGSWNAAIAAAGFQPRSTHGGGGNELRKRSVRDKLAASPAGGFGD